MPLILTDYQDSIGTITLNNLEKRNCFSNTLLTDMIDAFQEFRELKARAVIIRAPSGVKVWSSGLDITELPESGRDPLSYYDPLEKVMRTIEQFPAPVIAMVEGSVYGGACDLTFTCDLTVGCQSASFVMTPARIGVPYNPSGILHFVNIVGLRIAREMFFTGLPINAERALAVGILNYLVPTEVLEAYTYSLAQQITENSPLSISVIKEILRILGNSSPLSPETFERIQGLRRQVYDSQDYNEGKLAFIEKRKPIFKGK